MKKTFLPVFVFSFLFAIFFSAFSSISEPGKIFHITNADTSFPLTIKAKDHKGKSVVSSNEFLTFITGLDNDYYQVDSNHKTGYLYIETKIAKFLNDTAKRVPLNISIVIDRSGSMTGIKMGYAKKAAKGIINQLKPEDYVSVVMYDNAVDSVQTPVRVIDKAQINARIDGIFPRGGTDLWGGTEKGYEFVTRNYKPGFINRVLLISDGLANVGLTDSNLIRIKVQKFKDDNGITLSTFGVGLDYNERLMTDMAETGSGNYYFIDSPDKIAGLFNKELKGLLNVAVQNAELRIRLPKGVTIENGYPLKFQEKDGEVVVWLRDLFSEETKGTLFKFNIANNLNSEIKFLATLTYTEVINGSQKKLTHENILNPVKNIDAYLTHFNRNVIEQTILFTANENLEKAMFQVDKRNFESARQLLDINRAYLKANSYYVKGYETLKVMDSVNTNYAQQSSKAQGMNADSIKMFQKTNRAANYNLRNKKH